MYRVQEGSSESDPANAAVSPPVLETDFCDKVSHLYIIVAARQDLVLDLVNLRDT